VSAGGRGHSWIFIHGTDIVDKGLIVLFFGRFLLFFRYFAVALPHPGKAFNSTIFRSFFIAIFRSFSVAPLGNFSANALAKLRKRHVFKKGLHFETWDLQSAKSLTISNSAVWYRPWLRPAVKENLISFHLLSTQLPRLPVESNTQHSVHSQDSLVIGHGSIDSSMINLFRNHIHHLTHFPSFEKVFIRLCSYIFSC